jgi:preprotein translocase SecE subunit
MTHHSGTTKRSRFRFIGDTIAELKKVTWLKWPNEVLYLTALVLVVAIAVGLILGATDYGFTNLVDKFFLGR